MLTWCRTETKKISNLSFSFTIIINISLLQWHNEISWLQACTKIHKKQKNYVKKDDNLTSLDKSFFFSDAASFVVGKNTVNRVVYITKHHNQEELISADDVIQ